jgi:hypothetical protein
MAGPFPDVDYAGAVRAGIGGVSDVIEDAARFIGFKEGPVHKAIGKGGSSGKGAKPINVPRRVVGKAKSTKAKAAVKSTKSRAKRPHVGKQVAKTGPTKRDVEATKRAKRVGAKTERLATKRSKARKSGNKKRVRRLTRRIDKRERGDT